MIESGPTLIDLDRIDLDPANPRRDTGDLSELVASVKEQGVLQPVLLRPGKGDRFLLVAGRRRYQAAIRARLGQLPAVVRAMNDQEARTAGLVENMQRENLTPIEEAEGLAQLVELTGWSLEELAGHVHKARPTISNALRILASPPPIRAAVAEGRIGVGLALVAMAVEDPSLASKLHLRRGVTRDEIERQVRELNEDWRLRAGGALVAAKAAMARAQKEHGAETVITWSAEPRPDGLDMRKALGKPPRTIVGELDELGAKATKLHDRICEDRFTDPAGVWAVVQREDGFAVVRVCIDDSGWRRVRRELGGAGDAAKRRAEADRHARQLAGRLLAPEVAVRARLAPVRKRFTRTGYAGEAARLIAWELGRRRIVRNPGEPLDRTRTELALWELIAGMPLGKVRALAVDLAAADIAPLALAPDARLPRSTAAVLQHFGLREIDERRRRVA